MGANQSYVGTIVGKVKRWIEIFGRMDALEQKVTQMGLTLDQVKAEFQQRADALTAEVAAGKTIAQSVEALLNGQSAQLAALRQQVADLLAGVDPATVQPILDAFDAQLATAAATRAELTTAVQANVVTP